MIIKQKRKILNNNEDSLYAKFIENISRKENVFLYGNEIDSTELIKNTNLSISMPFTSSSLIAKFLGKKTLYYDPTSSIAHNDDMTHQIDLIDKKEDLLDFIKNLM